MIITRTPFRISFVGGGTDIQDFYQQHPGRVLSATINKYMYISTHRFFDENKIQVKYSRTETVTDKSEIQHPIIREIFDKFGADGLELSSIADIASGTGMGSSSSFTVGVLHNFYTRRGEFVSKEKLAQEACDIEINRLGEPIGKQDQYAAAYGGINSFEFLPNQDVTVTPLFLSHDTLENLEDHLLLFYIGGNRSASKMLEQQKQEMNKDAKINAMKTMAGLVPDLMSALKKNVISDFGKILHENWELKRSLTSQISNPQIDDIYNAGMAAGAYGGKLLGAGGGGFMLFCCPPSQQQVLKEKLKDLRIFPFKFEMEGSKILYVGDE